MFSRIIFAMVDLAARKGLAPETQTHAPRNSVKERSRVTGITARLTRIGICAEEAT